MDAFITPRIYYEKNENYFRYVIEKSYFDYFKKFGIYLTTINYDKKYVSNIFKKKIKVVVFSGGNDIYAKTKNRENKKRDEFEYYLFKKCIKKKNTYNCNMQRISIYITIF